MVSSSIPMLNKPNRRVDSVLINFSVFKLFANWFDKKDDNCIEKNMPKYFFAGQEMD